MAKKPRVPRNPAGLVHWRRDNLFGPFFTSVVGGRIKTAGNFLGAGKPGSGPQAVFARALDPLLVEVRFSLCVSISAVVGIEISIDGGAWTQVASLLKTTDTIWTFVPADSIALGADVRWRYIGGSGSIVDCDEAEDIGAQGPLSVSVPDALSIDCGAPPVGIVGEEYFHAVLANGGWPPVAVSIQSGTLPAGLTETNGVISGTPTTEETQSATWMGTDDELNTDTCGTSVKIVDVLVIDTTSLPNARVGSTYTQTLAASGGEPAYLWSVASGFLPTGLMMSSGGVISGTPTREQTSDFVARVDDASEQIDLQSLQIIVQEASSYVPLFEALLPDGSAIMQGVLTGIGTLADARASSINLGDWEGSLVEFDGAEIPWTGGRVTGALGSRVVYATDDGDAPLPELPSVVHAPGATNIALQSIDFSYGWLFPAAVTHTLDATTAPNGSGSGNQLDAASGSNCYFYNNVVFGPKTADSDNVLSLFVKQIDARYVLINLSAGGSSVHEAFYDFLTDDFDEVGASVEAYGAEHFGDGWVRIWIATNLSTVEYSVATVRLGFSDVADRQPTADVSGFFWGAQIEEGSVPSPPIYTLGANVTRDACDQVFDSANHDDTEGTYFVEVELPFGDCSILDGFLSYSGGDVVLSDGTNQQSISAADGARKIGIVYGSGTMKLNVDGVWHGTGGPYDGSLLAGALDIYRASALTASMRNLNRWEEKDELIVDAEMAA